MAQVEQLNVKIKGDIRDFKSKMQASQKVARNGSKRINKSVESIKGRFGAVSKSIFNFKNSLTAVVGAAGLGALVKSSLGSADAMAKLSRNTGVQAGLLQELSFAASQTGVSQNDLNASMLRFNRRIADANNGSKEFKAGFDALGVSLKDNNGNLRSTEDILFDVADGVKGLGNESEQAAALFRVFGDSGFKLVNLFKGGADDLRNFQKQARSLGLVLSQDVLQSAEKTNDQLDIMGRVLSAEISRAVINLAPEIQALTQGMIEFTRSVAKGTKILTTFGENTEVERVKFLRDRIRELSGSIEQMQKSADDPGFLQKIFGGPSEDLIEQRKTQLQEFQAELSSLEKKILEQRGITKGANEGSIQEQAQKNALLKKEIKARAELQERAKGIVAEAQGGDRGAQLEEELSILKRAKEGEAKVEQDLIDTIKKKRQDLADFKTEKNQAEIEKLLERNELLAEVDEEKHSEEIERNQRRLDQLKEQEKENSDFILNLKKKEAEKKEAIKQNEIEAAKQTLSNIAALTKNKTKSLFELSKAASTAEAIINTYQGATKALAQGGVFGPALAATVIGTGLAQVATIQAQSFRTGADELPGIGTKDSIPAILAPKERVVPRETNKDLKQFLKNQNGGGGGQPVNVSVNITTETLDSVETGERIVESINRAIKRKGAFLVSR